MLIDLSDYEISLIKKALYTKIDSLDTYNRKQKRYKVLLKKIDENINDMDEWREIFKKDIFFKLHLIR